MLIKRTFALADIVLRAHILNPLWLPRDRRRARRCAVATEAIPRYLKRYVHPGAVKEVPAVRNDADEKVFMFWGFKPKPPLVDACMRSAQKHLAQKVLLLDENSLYDYIELPGYVMDKLRAGRIAPAHFLDICRVELLHNHGGLWLDATCFVSHPIPKEIVDQDFFVYMAGNSVGSPYSFIQNCFIRGRSGAYLLESWRAVILEFWKNEPREFDYFMHQLMFKALVQNDPIARKYFEKMPHIDQDPTHALWWSFGDKPFDKKLFDEITAKVFFQKTTYNSEFAKNPKPGTFADFMINKI
jgi:hypothetical protein